MLFAQYREGDLVHNVETREDGKVLRVYADDDGNVRYAVSVPISNTSWMLGSTPADWPEPLLRESKNEILQAEDDEA